MYLFKYFQAEPMEETRNVCGTYKVWHLLHAAMFEPVWSTGAHI